MLTNAIPRLLRRITLVISACLAAASCRAKLDTDLVGKKEASPLPGAVTDREALDNSAANAPSSPKVPGDTPDGQTTTASLVAVAGSDFTVTEVQIASLDGTALAPATAGAINYFWHQISGPPVALSNVAIANPTFAAPELREPATLIFELQVSDGTQTSAPDRVSITISAIDDAPVISTLADTAIPDSTSASVAFTVNDVDSPLLCTSAHLAMQSANTALVPPGNVVWQGAPPNCTAVITPTAVMAGSSNLTISITDGSQTISRSFALTVTNANLAPTDMTLSATAIDENMAINTVAGSFSTVDANTANTHAYTLVSGSGSDDNGSFEIDGNQLRVKAVFDFEAKSSYSVRVRTSDNGIGTLSFEKTFTITVNDLVEPYCHGLRLLDSLFSHGPSPYIVCTLAQLDEVRTNLAQSYKVGANIDAADTALPTWDSGKGFAPIGTDVARFTGQFNGDNYTISNLKINRPAENEIGLFGVVSSTGSITNLNLTSVNVTGNNYTGAVAGKLYGLISNVSVQGSVTGVDWTGGVVAYTNPTGPISGLSFTGTLAGGDRSGGVVGQLQAQEINTSRSHVTITATIHPETGMIGGLVGHAESTAVKTSASNAWITANGYEVGGLVGWAKNSTVSDSHADGNVYGRKGYVGGLVGHAEDATSDVTRSYSHADVSLKDGVGEGVCCVGGLVGRTVNSDVTESFATGNVVGGEGFGAGGLVGFHNYGDVTDTWASAAVSSQRLSAPGPLGIGGLLGNNFNGDVRNSYSTGYITSIMDGGGLVGLSIARYGGQRARIYNSYSTSGATSTSLGGVASYIAVHPTEPGLEASIDANSRWDKTASGGISLMCGTIIGAVTGCTDSNFVENNATYWFNSGNQPMVNWDFAGGQQKWQTATNTHAILVWQKTHQIFTTSTTHTGSLGGIAGADAICQTRATAASLSGTWKAILSDSATDARYRIDLKGPIYNMNSQLLGSDLRKLFDGGIDASAGFDESGTAIGATAAVWTSTQANKGIRTSIGVGSEACQNWTAAGALVYGDVGSHAATNSDWLESGEMTCNTPLHLYCISQ